MKLIRVSEENKKRIMAVPAEKIRAEKKPLSINDAITLLLDFYEQYHKEKTELSE